MEYRRKPLKIKAFQLKRKAHEELVSLGSCYEEAKCLKEFPDWLQRLFKKIGDGIRVPFYNPNSVEIHQSVDTYTVNPNDWIVFESVTNQIKSYNTKTFKKIYEEVN